MSGAIEAHVVSNNHFAADRFRVRLALAAQPGAAVYWAQTSDVSIEVLMSKDGVSFSSLIEGAVDHVQIDPIQGTAYIEGRDLTARFIDTRTQDTFSNRTSSEIAQILAERHSMDAEVTSTTTPVGRYYQSEHDRITLNQFSRATTEWDLLTFLAEQEGFDVFVSGSTLFFQEPSQRGSLHAISPSDLIDLQMERALTLAGDIEVTVKSWNARQQNAFTQTARVQGRAQSSGRPQRYIYVRPNLTSEQALQFAQRKLAELSRHERTVRFSMPGELDVSARDIVLLTGTGTDFDRSYFVETIERSLHIESGFLQHVCCKNMNPISQSSPPGDIVASTTN